MRNPKPRRTRAHVYLAGAALLAASVVAAPIVILLARRPKPRPYREEVRERNRLATLLDAEETEYAAAWGPRRVA